MFERKNFVENTYEELVEYREALESAPMRYLSKEFCLYRALTDEIKRREKIMKLKERLHGLVEKIAVV